MRKILLIVVSFLVVLIAPAASYAIESNATSTSETEAAETSITPTRKVMKDTLKQTTTRAKDVMKETVSDAKEGFMEKMESAREEFKSKLAGIKDQKKAERLTNLDSKISDVNKRKTTQMSERLEKLSGILSRISTKGAALKSQGKNTTALDLAITDAQKAWDEAKTAVDVQMAKDYLVDITTEATLKNAASTTIKEFLADMKEVHGKIQLAQQGVRKAHVALTELMGDKVTPTVTTTP